MAKKNLFERFSHRATAATGSSAAFIIAVSAIIVWAAIGSVVKNFESGR